MNYAAIQKQIEQARIQQSVFVAEFVAEEVFQGWQLLKRAAGILRTAIEGTSDYLPRSQA